MTFRTVVHTCGHPETHEIVGPNQARRDWIVRQWAKDPCPRCVAEQWEARVAAENATYAARAAQLQLPALHGTPGQAAWATTIRGQFVDSLRPALEELVRAAGRHGHTFTDGADAVHLVEQIALRQTTAPWWITNQRRLGKALLEPAVYVELKAAGPAGVTARALLMWTGRR